MTHRAGMYRDRHQQLCLSDEPADFVELGSGLSTYQCGTAIGCDTAFWPRGPVWHSGCEGW